MRRNLIFLVAAVLLTLTELAAAGNIAFKQAQNYPVGTNPVWVVAGDFNNDGKRDLAVINVGDASASDPGGVSILLGNGDGTFQAANNIAIGKNCTSAVAGDFDGDGNEDLALVRPGDGSVGDDGDVTIFLGNGDGTFRQGQLLTPGKNPSSSQFSIATVDFNGDQRLDLVVFNSGDKTFSVLLGNGNGTFQSPVAYSPSILVPQKVLVVDLNGTGSKDLVVFGYNAFSIWGNNGDGTFRQICNPPGNGYLFGNFNGDEKADLVRSAACFISCGNNFPGMAIGNGDGTFRPAISIGQFVSAAGDFDGDGKLDLAGNATGPQIQILQGNGDGTFQPPIVVASGASLLQALDVNGDGAPDLVTIGNNSIGLLVNVGTDFSISAASPNPGTLSAGQSATSSLTLKLLTNFNNPVSLACAVQPSRAGAPSCALNSNSVTFDSNGNATATLTIGDGSSVSSLNSVQQFAKGSFLSFPVVGFALLGTGIGVSPSRKKRFVTILLGAVLLIGFTMQTACGGGSGNGGPKSTAYTVTITGTSGATQHSTAVSLNVK